MLAAISIAPPSTVTFPLKLLSPVSKSSFNGMRVQRLCPNIGVRLLTESSRRPCPLSSLVVMMAKREEDTKEIRTKTTEKINEEVVDLKGELFNEEVVDLKGELFMLRLQKSARNKFTSSEFRRMRKRGENDGGRDVRRTL